MLSISQTLQLSPPKHFSQMPAKRLNPIGHEVQFLGVLHDKSAVQTEFE